MSEGAPYRIEFEPKAAKEFEKLPPDIKSRVGAKIDQLAQEPRPSGAKKLIGHKNRYRIRAGDWRVIYRIEDKIILVTVTRVAHRGDIYDR